MTFISFIILTSVSYLLVITLAVANPQNDGSWGPSIGPDDPITFTAYNGYFNLRPCLRDMFGNNGATINQIAENVGCDTNRCLCDTDKIESNVEILSTQVPSRCTDIRGEDISKATGILSGYCAIVSTSTAEPIPETTLKPTAESTLQSTAESSRDPTPSPTSEAPDTNTEPSVELPRNKIYTATEASGQTTLVTEIINSSLSRSSSSASTPSSSSPSPDVGSGKDDKDEKDGLETDAIVGIAVGIPAAIVAMATILKYLYKCCS